MPNKVVWTALSGAVTAVALFAPAFAQVKQFDIPSEEAGKSLLMFVRQSGVQIIAPGDKLRGVITPELKGAYEVDLALERLLKGTGLVVRRTPEGGIAISLGAKEQKEEQDGMSLGLKNSASMTAVALAFLAGAPALAQDVQTVETVTVTGFRGSLEAARENKRNATNMVESIVAEDIGKMPDLNIAESIQRIPGVAMTREGGEGRNITLRGLGSDFTRATLNGMEVPASSDGLDSGGVTINAGRTFDFHIFAADLFNRIDVEKTQQASKEEGGIAGTVDLYTAKPFDFDGLTVTGAVQEGYNTLSGVADPRVTLMASDTFLDNKLGVLVSAAFSRRTVHQEGFGSVLWESPYETGDTWADTSPTVTGTASDFCGATDSLNCLYAPRLPRADYFGNKQKRLGLSTAIQYRPIDSMLITLDVLHSELDNDRYNYNSMEWLLTHGDPGNYTGQTPLSFKVADNGKQLIAASFDNVTSWYESRHQTSVSMFNQYALTGEWEITKDLTFNTMVGLASDNANRTELRIYARSIPHYYSYDYSNDENVPVVSYGSYDPNKFSNYINAITASHRNNGVKKENFISKADVIYKLGDYTFKTGIDYNDRQIVYSEGTGNTPSFDPSSYMKAFPVSDFGSGLPSGGLQKFAVMDFDALMDAGIYTNTYTPTISAGWTVDERTLGGYFEANGEFEVAGMRLRANTGLRYVRTSLKSSAVLSGTPTTVARDYDNFLPSVNLALDVSEEFVTRFSYGRSMTRPGLGSLNIASPVFTYSTRSVGNIGNPDLKPYKSNDFDLSLEYYFTKGGLLAIGAFDKEIVSSITTETVTKSVPKEYWAAIYADPLYDSSYNADPANVKYTFTTAVNAKGGNNVKGLEFTYNQPFTVLTEWMPSLPHWVGNFGFASNYTYVSAKDSTGLSPNSYNFTFYYDTGDFGIRTSINKRDDYLLSSSPCCGNAEEYKYGPMHVDFAAYYNYSDHLTFTIEGINITDEMERIYDTGDGTLNMTREFSHTGSQWFAGIRYRY